MREQQAQRLKLEAYTQLSPLFEKLCLRVSANEAYQKASQEVEALTGIAISHSTLQRLVNRCEMEWPTAKQTVVDISVDGGKVRVRTEQAGQESQWLEYKSARISGIYYGATFKENAILCAWINTQPLAAQLTCLGDGHDGVWNVFAEVADEYQRLEILDWFHLKENLYKVGGSLQRLKQAEEELWQGQVDMAIARFSDCQGDPAKRFQNYLERHRKRIVNYSYLQSEGFTIGSGAVESSIKQIDQRLKKTGAQWAYENVPQVLQVRCAYLNGMLAV